LSFPEAHWGDKPNTIVHGSFIITPPPSVYTGQPDRGAQVEEVEDEEAGDIH